MFQHNQFLGEICIPFDTYEFETPMQEKFYKLNDYSKMDMIPNPHLERRRSTIYRVRTKVPESITGVPTLYDSSTDLRAVGEEGANLSDENKEENSSKLPVINVESEDLKSESDKESATMSSERVRDQSPVAFPVDVSYSPSTTPEQLSSRSSSSASQAKCDSCKTPSGKKSPTSLTTKSPTTKSPTAKIASEHQSKARKPLATSTPKSKYHTVSASTRPSTAAKIVSSSKQQCKPKGGVQSHSLTSTSSSILDHPKHQGTPSGTATHFAVKKLEAEKDSSLKELLI